MDTWTGVVITIILLTGGTITMHDILMFITHRKPWILRNRRRPRQPRP